LSFLFLHSTCHIIWSNWVMRSEIMYVWFRQKLILEK